MAYRTLYFRRDDGTKLNRFFIFDTAAELLSATLIVGDQAYTVDTKVFYLADSTTTWTPINNSGTPGSVTTVSVVTANGVSGSVANATTTPAITLTLGAITPTTIVASSTIAGSNLSGTNTGNVTLSGTPDYITLSGQVLTRAKLDPADDLNTFASSVLAGLLTDETGTDKVVFNTTPTLVTPVLGAATGTSLALSGAIGQLGGSTGVSISAASGIMTIAGIGNTNNEGLKVDLEGNANIISLTTVGVGAARELRWYGNEANDHTFLKLISAGSGKYSAIYLETNGNDWSIDVGGSAVSDIPNKMGFYNETDADDYALVLSSVNSAVNHLELTNSITTVAPTITAVGTDSVISLNLVPKSTGTLQVGGVAGISGTLTSADLVGKTLTFTKGLITGYA